MQFKIPSWMRSRRRGVKDGESSQKYATCLESLREDLVRSRRVRLHRGFGHHWGIRVRGQHTKTTGRHRAIADIDSARKT